jgi:O-antigen ligase
VIGSVVSILFIGAILLSFLDVFHRKTVFPADRGVMAIVASFVFYVLADTISAIFNNDGWVTWREIIEDLPFLGFAFIYARVSLLNRKDLLDAVERGAIYGSFAMLAVVGTELIVTQHDRPEGMAGNPGVLALVSSLVYGICLLAATRRHGRMRWVALTGALCAATTVLFAGTRALWPFLFIAPVIPLIILRPVIDWAAVRRGAIISTLPLVAMAYLTCGSVERRLEALETDLNKAAIGNFDSSIGERITMWKSGLNKALERPLLGLGPGFERSSRSQGVHYTHYHNFLLNAMVRSGVLGVTAIVSIFIVPIWVFIRRLHDDVSRAGLSLLLILQCAFLLSGSVGIMLGHDIHDALFIFGTTVATALISRKQETPAGCQRAQSA